MSLRICILETDILRPELVDQYQGYGQMFQRLFSQQPIAAEFTVYNVMQGEYPGDDLTFDAYLVTGSKADSFGTDPWIETLRAYLLNRYERGDKLLGVCFGHQLLALLLGGKSERATQGWGVGTHNYKLAAKAPWMSPVREELTLVDQPPGPGHRATGKRHGHRLQRFLPVRRVPHQRSGAVLPGASGIHSRLLARVVGYSSGSAGRADLFERYGEP